MRLNACSETSTWSLGVPILEQQRGGVKAKNCDSSSMPPPPEVIKSGVMWSNQVRVSALLGSSSKMRSASVMTTTWRGQGEELRQQFHAASARGDQERRHVVKPGAGVGAVGIVIEDEICQRDEALGAAGSWRRSGMMSAAALLMASLSGPLMGSYAVPLSSRS
jgi:hypothetical protein